MVASFTTSFVYTEQVLDSVLLVVASLTTSSVHTGGTLYGEMLVVASLTTGQVLDGVMLAVASLSILVCILDIKMTTFVLHYAVTQCRYTDGIFHNYNQTVWCIIVCV